VDAVADYASVIDKLKALLPADAVVVGAHTHLGRDEDEQVLDPAELLAALDEVSPHARACTFRFTPRSGHPPTGFRTTAFCAGRRSRVDACTRTAVWDPNGQGGAQPCPGVNNGRAVSGSHVSRARLGPCEAPRKPRRPQRP
jgi:hypothetical protein